jgi:hypothetical protein
MHLRLVKGVTVESKGCKSMNYLGRLTWNRLDSCGYRCSDLLVDEELQCRYYCLGFCTKGFLDNRFFCKAKDFSPADCTDTAFGDLTMTEIVPTEIETAK